MRKVKPIFRIQPIQQSTVELVPLCSIPGTFNMSLVTGDDILSTVTLTRENAQLNPVHDGLYKIVTTAENFTVENVANGVKTGNLTYQQDISNVIPGFKININQTASSAPATVIMVDIIGDQTHIIPGTVVGRLKNGANVGKWQPVNGDDDIENYDAFRIVSTYQETDKSKTVLSYGNEINLSDVYSIDVVVYGEIIEKACKEINLTDKMKAKMNQYAWL